MNLPRCLLLLVLSEANNKTLTLKRLETLKEHQETLISLFKQAKENIIIVSPYLRNRAVMADEIPQLVKEAVQRGVKVMIYTDDGFNDNLQMESAALASKQLVEAGAMVIVCHNIHSKVLCMDESLYIEGSFNWLSAERTRPDLQRFESSLLYQGTGSKAFITATLNILTQRKLHQITPLDHHA